MPRLPVGAPTPVIRRLLPHAALCLPEDVLHEVGPVADWDVEGGKHPLLDQTHQFAGKPLVDLGVPIGEGDSRRTGMIGWRVVDEHLHLDAVDLCESGHVDHGLSVGDRFLKLLKEPDGLGRDGALHVPCLRIDQPSVLRLATRQTSPKSFTGTLQIHGTRPFSRVFIAIVIPAGQCQKQTDFPV